MAHGFTAHKERAAWFHGRAAMPPRDADPSALEDYWAARQALEQSGQAGLEPEWQCAGPFNIGGRVTALAVIPGRQDVLLAGSSAGGVWRSTDSGHHWEFRWPKWVSQHIGALAADPSDSGHLYCGTGEANLSGDSYAGSGLLESRDGGLHWHTLVWSRESHLPRRIGALAVDPFDSDHLALGGVTHSEVDPGGLFLSRNGGRSWYPAGIATRNYLCHAVVFDPRQKGLLYAAINAKGMLSGIWRSENGGKRWDHLGVDTGGAGLPSGDRFGRTSLALAPSNPNVVYAFAGDPEGKVLGVFRSGDNGDTWKEVGGHHFSHERSLTYNTAIAVHPKHPDFVLAGAVDLHRTQDGAFTWIRASDRHAPKNSGHYVHADHHALVFSIGDRVYSGNDGGVAVSVDGGKNWSGRSQNLVTTMFYSVDVAPSNSRYCGGGTQDNGTLLTGMGSRQGYFHQVLPGDGGWTVFHPDDEKHVIGSSQNLRISRHHPGTGWEEGFWKVISPDVPEDERKQKPITIMAIDTRKRQDCLTHWIWVGSNRLWVTKDYGDTWKPSSPVFDGSAVTAIEVSDLDHDTVLVGTAHGGIFRTRDGGKTWSGNLAGPYVPARLISDIESHPRYPNRILATVAGTGMGRHLVPTIYRSRHPDGTLREESFSHVFASNDGGDSWFDVDRGRLPDVAYHALEFETHPPYRAFVAGDCGVWMWLNGHWEDEAGGMWADVSGNLPNVSVSDLVYHHGDRMLMAATQGRGLWRLDTDS